MNEFLVRILNLSSRSRRLLALSILFATTLVLSASIAQLVAGVRAEIWAVTAQRELIGRQELAVKTMQTAIESGKAINVLLKNAFLQGDSEAVAEASLQSWMSDTATNLGIEMNAISGAEPTDDGALRMIGVRTSVTGPYDRILQLLAAIEAATPGLTIVKGEFISSQDEMMDDGQAQPSITANLTIMGVPAPGTQKAVAEQ